MELKRVCLVVLDSAGCGALPDAARYGDEGANTFGSVFDLAHPSLQNMAAMGLGRIPGTHCPDAENVIGAYGRAMERSVGKDTTTGHWEMAGLNLTMPFPTYPDGFPAEVIDAFEERIGTRVLGNKPASGTAILDELGPEHQKTGYPIVYTSGDSVFQIACHEELYSREQLYEMCRKARALLQGEHGVGRVIARPFIGRPGAYTRTDGRRDFSLPPIAPTLLDVMKEHRFDVRGVGKIEDIFEHQGLTASDHAVGNPACMEAMLRDMEQPFTGLEFVNLVDFDSSYGHRRDVEGYAKALEEFDRVLPALAERMREGDLLIITADHGCDPTFRGTDHTREYVPILCRYPGMKKAIDLGTRRTYADIAATIAEGFGLPNRFDATSFWREIM